MDNVLTLNKNNSVLSDSEIESLFKGFIKLVEKNTEQKLINSSNFVKENIVKKEKSILNLSVKSVKDLEELKKMAFRVFDENKKLKTQLINLEQKVCLLRSQIAQQDK